MGQYRNPGMFYWTPALSDNHFSTRNTTIIYSKSSDHINILRKLRRNHQICYCSCLSLLSPSVYYTYIICCFLSCCFWCSCSVLVSMVWYSQSNYFRSRVSLAQCTQPMMEEEWIRVLVLGTLENYKQPALKEWELQAHILWFSTHIYICDCICIQLYEYTMHI